MTAHRYEAAIDLSVDNAHSRVIRLVGSGKRVLELGCASGYVGRLLIEEFGCTVSGIERDAEEADRARQRGLRVIVGDLDRLDLSATFGEERFDVAVCGDVLEHLREPVRTLEGVRGLLAPGGYLVASVPNIAHISIVAELLEGRFDYRPLGLLDETHLRFFTRHSLCACLREAGFVLTRLDRLCREPEETEFRTDLRRFPREVEAVLRVQEEATTYQFIVQAVPADARDHDGSRTAEPCPERAGPERTDLLGRSDALRVWARFLEDERQRQHHEVRELQEEARNLWTMIRQRDHDLAELRDLVERLKGDLQRRDGELTATAERMRALAEEGAGFSWRRRLMPWRRS